MSIVPAACAIVASNNNIIQRHHHVCHHLYDVLFARMVLIAFAITLIAYIFNRLRNIDRDDCFTNACVFTLVCFIIYLIVSCIYLIFTA